MKKIIGLLSAIIMIFGMTTVVLAVEGMNPEDVLLIAPAPTSEIKVQQNGTYIDFTDSEGNVVNPQIINSRTMVPFRKIFNALGVTDENISWDGETKTVIAKKDAIEIELQIDNTTAKKTISGDTTEMKLDSAPVIMEGRTLVPVRFIAESMNKKVGWDADNRTVIIIDTEELVNDLESAIPKYMEMVNDEVKSPDTYGLKMNLKGKIEYKSSDNKTDNSTLNLSGTINVNKTSDIIALDVDTKISGKGELYNALKESNALNFSYHMIINDNKLYLKSTSTDAQTGGKWTVTEDDSFKELFQAVNGETTSFDHIFDVEEEQLTVDTYQSMQTLANVLKTVLSDRNIDIATKGSTKTYTITLKLSDIMDALKDAKIETSLTELDASMKLTSTYKKETLQSSGCSLELKYEEGNESITGTISAEGKLSNSSKVSIPSSSQVIDANEI